MILMKEQELAAIRQAGGASQLGRLRDAIVARTRLNTAEPTLVQSGDTQEWWHLVWERFGDAAFVVKLNSDKQAGAWLHDRTLELVRKPLDEWIGPWFRRRSDPPSGALETAHVTNAVCTALDLAGELFGSDERDEILSALREKGLVLCKRFLDGGHRNNWFCVLAGGFAMAAAMLDDREACEFAVKCYERSLSFYDEDGYGETLQYGNYASLSLVNLRRTLIGYDASYAARLPIDPIASTVRWAVSSHLYMKPIDGERRGVYPRSANFGDSAAIFRPTGDLLISVACECEDRDTAGLARWLFDRVYSDPTLGPDELASFGFFNQFGFASLCGLLTAPSASSPEQVGMPTKSIYKTGTATLRDSWEEPQTILAVQCGYERHGVGGHRHFDQNSFILAHRNERFFADPGHCCYRLETWKQSKLTAHHNTWDFIDESGGCYTQRQVKPFEEPLNRLVQYDAPEGFEIIASDCAKAYGEHFTRCERVFICAFPGAMFIVDRIETDIPMKVISHFVLNNRDGGLNVHEADSHRLVLRRGSAGVKFFTFCADNRGDGVNIGFDGTELSKRRGFIHDSYHPLPNHIGQGKEGSSVIYDYTSSEFSKKHTVIHAIAMDDTVGVKGWHIKPEGGLLKIYTPKNLNAFILRLGEKEKWFEIIKN